MLGEKKLKELFPEFKETVQPSGIDLKLGEVYEQIGSGSLINNEKKLPPIKKVDGPLYKLEPKKAYLMTVDRKIKIPKGYSMLYLPRSTLLRSFLSVHTAVGDPGFYGTLQFMVYNYGNYNFTIKQGERFAQAVVFEVEGSGEYNGSYQENEE